MSDKKVKPKAKVNPNDVAAAPSAGGTVRAGKDSANCDDALGDPGRHHGEASQAVIVSGRGPAAAEKQHTTGRRTGINSENKDDYAKATDVTGDADGRG